MGSIQTHNGVVTLSGSKIPKKVNSDYAIAFNDDFLAVDCTNGNVNIVLPSALSAGGIQMTYAIKKVDNTASVVNITTADSETIDGIDRFVLDEPQEAINLISDGLNWLIF